MKEEGWINVEDRLPEESCDVMVDCGHDLLYYVPYSARHKKFNVRDRYDDPTGTAFDGVIAWRYIEPYVD